MIISTALASRGTDISVTRDVIDAGGLHVLLTYLPKDGRTQRQIIGRTGRKGQAGSCRLIINRQQTEEQLQTDTLGSEKDMLERRDAIEGLRVEDLEKSLDVVRFREELFETFCGKLKELDSKFTDLEIENEGEYNHQLDQLRQELRNRKLDYKAANHALKESWAFWYSELSPQIEKSVASTEKKEHLILALKNKLDSEIEKLTNGTTTNVFHMISHAIGRSYLYDNNSKQKILDVAFVLNAWKQVESVCPKQDHRYLSAVYYNIAYYTILSKSSDYITVAYDYLVKARDVLKQYMGDIIVESNCVKSCRSNGMFRPHVADITIQTNLSLQMDNKLAILQRLYSNREELIQKMEKFKEEKKEEDINIEAKNKEVLSLFKEDKDPILTRELSMTIGDGNFLIFDVEKEPVKGKNNIYKPKTLRIYIEKLSHIFTSLFVHKMNIHITYNKTSRAFLQFSLHST